MSWKKSTFRNWEFWPYWIFYIPVYTKWLWLGLRAGSLMFFRAANPSMNLGGFCNYSKFESLSGIDAVYVPKMVLIPMSSPLEDVHIQLTRDIGFPMILKPDKGERGTNVEKIDSTASLEEYLRKAKGDTLAQEYIAGPLELGVMYSRLPSASAGVIDSIVQKEFLTVTGNGRLTLEELIDQGDRTSIHKDKLVPLFRDTFHTTIEDQRTIELIAIGNHNKGTTFLNANHLINPELLKVFDHIWSTMDGFYFGRFDIRVPNTEDLYAGRNIKIMEVNGAASEPAHIYDPQMSIWDAYHHLFEHWHRLFLISRENHRKGVAYPHLYSSIKEVRQHIKFRNT